MIIEKTNIPLFTSTILNEDAEAEILSDIIKMDEFSNPWAQRRVASYAYAVEAEKDILILELMKHLWESNDVANLFPVFRDFDAVFAILEKKGHFIHQFEVFLLGLFILRKLEKANKKVFRFHFGGYKQLFNSWLLTATAHDFGYPLEVSESLAKKFSTLYDKINLKNLAQKYFLLTKRASIDEENSLKTLRLYNKSKRKYQIIDIDAFVRESLNTSLCVENASEVDVISRVLRDQKNHGYISAMIVARNYLQLLNKLKSGAERWRIEELKLVTAAIALHAVPIKHEKDIEKISFNMNPLSFLLRLIDNLQEWNRSLRPSNQYPGYNLSKFSVGDRFIELHYILTSENWTGPMMLEAKKALLNKSKLLHLPQKPSPSFGFDILVFFKSNLGLSFPKVELSI